MPTTIWSARRWIAKNAPARSASSTAEPPCDRRPPTQSPFCRRPRSRRRRLPSASFPRGRCSRLPLRSEKIPPSAANVSGVDQRERRGDQGRPDEDAVEVARARACVEGSARPRPITPEAIAPPLTRPPPRLAKARPRRAPRASRRRSAPSIERTPRQGGIVNVKARTPRTIPMIPSALASSSRDEDPVDTACVGAHVSSPPPLRPVDGAPGAASAAHSRQRGSGRRRRRRARQAPG